MKNYPHINDTYVKDRQERICISDTYYIAYHERQNKLPLRIDHTLYYHWSIIPDIKILHLRTVLKFNNCL